MHTKYLTIVSVFQDNVCVHCCVCMRVRVCVADMWEKQSKTNNPPLASNLISAQVPANEPAHAPNTSGTKSDRRKSPLLKLQSTNHPMLLCGRANGR